MSRTELVEFAAAKTDVSKAEVGRVLDALLEGIQTGLKKEGKDHDSGSVDHQPRRKGGLRRNLYALSFPD